MWNECTAWKVNPAAQRSSRRRKSSNATVPAVCSVEKPKSAAVFSPDFVARTRMICFLVKSIKNLVNDVH